MEKRQLPQNVSRLQKHFGGRSDPPPSLDVNSGSEMGSDNVRGAAKGTRNNAGRLPDK